VILVLADQGVKQDRKDLKDPKDHPDLLGADSFPISLEERVS
jgi:hypothetical protein